MHWKVLGMITSCDRCPHLGDDGVTASNADEPADLKYHVFHCVALATRGINHVIRVPMVGGEILKTPLTGYEKVFKIPDECPLQTEWPKT